MVESLNVVYSTTPQDIKNIDCPQDVAKDVEGTFLLDEYVPMHMRRKNFPFVKKVFSTPPVSDSPSSTISTPPTPKPSPASGVTALQRVIREKNYNEISAKSILSEVNKFRKGKTPSLKAHKNTLYVPLKLIELLLNNKDLVHPKGCKNYSDRIMYVFSSLIKRTELDKRNSTSKEAPICKKVLENIIGEGRYDFIMNLLVNEWKVIEKTKSHVPPKKGAKGKSALYKVSEDFAFDIVSLNVRDAYVNRKLNKHKETIKKQQSSSNRFMQASITNSRDISLDTNKVGEYISQCSGNKQIKAELSVHAILNKDFYSAIDTFGDRVHTNLTSLNSDLRKCLRVGNQRLGQVDIGNSQPLFFFKYLRDNCNIPTEELDRYRYLVENRKFYTFFEQRFNLRVSDTVMKKRIITGVFNDKRRPKFSRYFLAFQEEFPTIAQEILTIKKGNYKAMIQLLQRYESDFIYNNVVKEWVETKPNVFITTIYDCIVVEQKNLNEAYAIMMKCFMDVNIFPTLTVKKF